MVSKHSLNGLLAIVLRARINITQFLIKLLNQ